MGAELYGLATMYGGAMIGRCRGPEGFVRESNGSIDGDSIIA